MNLGCASCSQAAMYPPGYAPAPEFRGLAQLDYSDPMVRTGLALISTAGMAVSAYHGYKRNRGSIGWTIGWALLGGAFPIITPVVAVAQGYAKPAR